MLAHHPQVRQRKQRVELLGVFLQAPVAHFDKPELALDDAKRVLDPGADARLERFDLVEDRVQGLAFIQFFPLAWAHGHMPAHVRLSIGALFDALVARIGKDDALAPVQQRVAFADIGHIARSAAHTMHQPKACIYTDMRFHPEIPLVALLARMHLGIALPSLVLGRAGRGDERGINQRARAQHQAALAQQIVDCLEQLFSQPVLLQPVAKPQDGALIGHASVLRKLGELTKQRRVEKRLLHRRV